MKMSGVLSRLKFRAVAIEVAVDQTIESGADFIAGRMSSEAEQLAQYYAEALTQYKLTFRFGVGFASLGLLAIAIAAFLHPQADVGTTIGRFVAGGGAESIAALFFVRANTAKQSMDGFFDRLRRDRDRDEARKLCESLPAGRARDALRIRLALHYAGVKNADANARPISRDRRRRGVKASRRQAAPR
jgi:hypothetical protein